MKFMDYVKLMLIMLPLGILLFVVLGLPCNMFTCILLLILTGVAYFILLLSQENKSMKHAHYNSTTKTLHLNDRDNSTENLIKLKRYTRINATYKPAEIVYTSATVGGITTGGVHINEAHYQTYGTSSDKYQLCYMFEDNPIEKISCNFSIGNNSYVNEFKIDDYTLELHYKGANKDLTNVEKEMFKNAINSGDTSMEYHLVNQKLEENLLSYEDCKNIKKWIGGQY